MPRGDAGQRRERGAGSVLVIAVLASVLAASLAVAAAVGMMHERATAQAAADAGALAGAMRERWIHATGESASGGTCAQAARAVAAAGASMVTCETSEGARVEVTVRHGRAVATAAAQPAYAQQRSAPS